MNNITTDLRFSMVPHWVTDSGISDRALRLYSVLAKFADAETGQAFPGRTRLSNELSCSLKSVDRAVSELMELGAVKKTQRVKDGHFQSSLYTVVRVDPGSDQTRPRVTDDATPRHDGPDPVSPVTHRTITTELEPRELEPHNYIDTKKSLNRNYRLPEDWYPSERLLEMFANKWPNVDRDFEVDQFINYWHAEGKTKADWDRAFQVWMNRAQQRAKPGMQARKMTNAEHGALLTLELRRKREQREALEAIEATKRLELEGEQND